MVRHTAHSVQQCKNRGFSPERVLEAIRSHQDSIDRSTADEVIVVVHVSRSRIYTGEGSGDVVAAFINPKRQTIKTVAWQRWEQIRRKAMISDWVNPMKVK